jgi:hypothetical protein
LVTIKPGHHDVYENNIWLVVSDLRQRIKAIHRGEHFTTLFRKQCLSRTPDRFRVIYDQNLQAMQTLSVTVSQLKNPPDYIHSLLDWETPGISRQETALDC